MWPAPTIPRASSCSGSGSSAERGHFLAHDLFRKPVPTFRDHVLLLAEQSAQLTAKRRGDIRALKRIGHVGGKKADLGTAVEAAAFEFETVERLAARQRHHGVGELDFAAGAGHLLFQQ